MSKKLLPIFIIACLILVSSLSSAYVRSSPQYTNSLGTSYYSDINEFSDNLCREGSDFVLQIAPFGCSPTVVRSDLLEEQNVAVFCQLAATQINPVISVKAIEDVTFSRSYPKEVAGVDFQPASCFGSN